MKIAELKDLYGERFWGELFRKVAEVGDENQEFVYCTSGSACHYDRSAGSECPEPGKGCIFGLALQRMGWTDPDELASQTGIQVLLRQELSNTPAGICGAFAYRLQAMQDTGTKWGKIAELAKLTFLC